MDKHHLAQELRQRQYKSGLVARWMIDALADDDIIDSYITCSACGEKQVDAQNLTIAIEHAQDANQFLQLCDELAGSHYKQTHMAPQQQRPPQRRNFQRNKNMPFKKRDW